MILDRRTAKQAVMLFVTIAVCTAQSYADAPNVAASPTECQPEAREHANVTFGSPPPLPSGSTNVIQIRDAFWSSVDYYASLESGGHHAAARRVIVSLERAMRPYLEKYKRDSDPFLDSYHKGRVPGEIDRARVVWSNPAHQDTHVFEWIDAAKTAADRNDLPATVRDLRSALVCDDFGEVHLLLGDVLFATGNKPAAHDEWVAALKDADIMAPDSATPNDWQYEAMRRLAKERS